MMESKEQRRIKVLVKEDLQKLFNCDRSKMNEIMHSKKRPPVIKIGREFYTTQKQIEQYFNHVDKREIGFNILHKKDLMELFRMGRTKFFEFIKIGSLPVKIIGQDYSISEQSLEKWFADFVGEEIKFK